MATIQKRKLSKKLSYIAMIRRRGFNTLVKSFSTRSEEKKWCRQMESKLDRGETTRRRVR